MGPFQRVEGGAVRQAYRACVRSFPFVPRSAARLEIGDFWTVTLSDGDFGVLQVRDLRLSGPGTRSSFVAGVVDWRGQRAPMAADLRGCRVLAQGLTCIKVFTEGGAQIIGNAPDTAPVDGLTSVFKDHGVGTRTSVWGWMALTRRVEKELAAAS
jgi:hypothetical protein